MIKILTVDSILSMVPVGQNQHQGLIQNDLVMVPRLAKTSLVISKLFLIKLTYRPHLPVHGDVRGSL